MDDKKEVIMGMVVGAVLIACVMFALQYLGSVGSYGKASIQHIQADRNTPVPNISSYAGNDGTYSYIVDNNTGVVYLQYTGIRATAISVMLNPDGTPIMAEQIGIGE